MKNKISRSCHSGHVLRVGWAALGLTDEAMEHGVPCVVGGDRVLPIDDAKLRPVLKRVLPKAEQV